MNSFTRCSVSLTRRIVSCSNILLKSNVAPLRHQSLQLRKQIPSVGSTLRFFSTGTNGIPVVSYEEVKNLPNEPNKILIDVREPEELKEFGQIPTSFNIPLGEVEKALQLSDDKFKALYGHSKPKQDDYVIFHCKLGRRSQTASETAAKLGYTNIHNYVGSWKEWAEKEGLPFA
ncbi:TSTD3.2 family protein [Megaselia abdita]